MAARRRIRQLTAAVLCVTVPDRSTKFVYIRAVECSSPTDDQIQVPWELPPRVPTHPSNVGRLRRALRTLGSGAALGPSTLTLARAAVLEQQLALPFRTPRTMLNVPIGGARRYAAQSWSLERIKAVKNALGATVNDVVLAMCAAPCARTSPIRTHFPMPADRDGAGEPAHRR